MLHARRVPSHHEAMQRVLAQRVDLRRRALDFIDDAAPSLEALHEAREFLQAHVRQEERVPFPLVEKARPSGELERLGAAAKNVERAA